MRFQVGVASRLTKWFPVKTALAVLLCATTAGGGAAWAEDPSCAPIRAVQEKLNATKRIQLSAWVLNDGFGKSGVTESRLFEWKTYWRWQEGPWHVQPRTPEPLNIGGIPAVSNCKHVGDESIRGVATTVFTYDRFRPQSKMRARMSISKETGLPVQTYFKGFEPNNSEEYMTHYTYNPAIDEPELGTKP